MEPKYPNIRVEMVGKDGNAFAILARCRQAMRKAGLPEAEWERFQAEATAANYDALLQVCISWFDVD